jgi:hypothetical protein
MVIRADPSGPARLTAKEVEAGVVYRDIRGIPPIPVIRQQMGEITGLPPEVEGVMYIVSRMVAIAAVSRNDLVSPARFVRDDKGMITGAMALEKP